MKKQEQYHDMVRRHEREMNHTKPIAVALVWCVSLMAFAVEIDCIRAGLPRVWVDYAGRVWLVAVVIALLMAVQRYYQEKRQRCERVAMWEAEQDKWENHDYSNSSN